jgi:hypothetical protein
MNQRDTRAVERLANTLEDVKAELAGLAQESFDLFDSLSEERQQSEYGQKLKQEAKALESAVSELDDCFDELEKLWMAGETSQGETA